MWQTHLSVRLHIIQNLSLLKISSAHKRNANAFRDLLGYVYIPKSNVNWMIFVPLHGTIGREENRLEFLPCSENYGNYEDHQLEVTDDDLVDLTEIKSLNLFPRGN